MHDERERGTRKIQQRAEQKNTANDVSDIEQYAIALDILVDCGDSLQPIFLHHNLSDAGENGTDNI